jgi:hypothetical protein
MFELQFEKFELESFEVLLAIHYLTAQKYPRKYFDRDGFQLFKIGKSQLEFYWISGKFFDIFNCSKWYKYEKIIFAGRLNVIPIDLKDLRITDEALESIINNCFFLQTLDIRSCIYLVNINGNFVRFNLTLKATLQNITRLKNLQEVMSMSDFQILNS